MMGGNNKMKMNKHVKKVPCSCGNCGKIINPFGDVDQEDYDIPPPEVEPYEYDYE